MVSKKMVVAAAVTVSSVLGIAGPAGATHVHSKQLGNGSCVVLAQNGGEKDVVLPAATGGIGLPDSRRHPLHMLVHTGRPGMNFKIGVYGTASDPCRAAGDYVND